MNASAQMVRDPGFDHRVTWQDAMVPNYATPELLLSRGVGSRVWDLQGTEYLDLLAGIATNVVGHCHPALVGAVEQQMRQLGHTSNLYANEPALKLATRLRGALGGRHKALFVNSGTEANEVAFKLMRKHANDEGRTGGSILALEGSFHGRTLGSLAITGQKQYRDSFGPMPAQVVHVEPTPEAIECAFDQHDVVGVFAEVLQGEGGVRPLSQETIAALSAGTKRSDAVLCIDEVQTGVGRTGSFAAYQQHDLDPDVITFAKGLGGGLPIGAAMVRDSLADVLAPGTHGCTFGGNPVASAAANAVLDVIEQEHLIQRAKSLGQRFAAAAGDHGVQLRGQGLLLGAPLAGSDAASAVRSLQMRGFLVGAAGPGVVRLAPALNIPEDDLLGALPALGEVIGPMQAAP